MEEVSKLENPNFERFGLISYAEKAVPQTSLNIERLFSEFHDLLNCKDVFMSKKANKCNCKNECLCVDEDYYTIRDVNVIWGSNCNIILSFRKPKDLKLRRNNGWCVYRLETVNRNEPDIEKPIFEVLKYPKDKKLEDSVGDNRWLTLKFNSEKTPQFQVKSYSCNSNKIELTICYMNWR